MLTSGVLHTLHWKQSSRACQCWNGNNDFKFFKYFLTYWLWKDSPYFPKWFFALLEKCILHKKNKSVEMEQRNCFLFQRVCKDKLFLPFHAYSGNKLNSEVVHLQKYTYAPLKTNKRSFYDYPFPCRFSLAAYMSELYALS